MEITITASAIEQGEKAVQNIDLSSVYAYLDKLELLLSVNLAISVFIIGFIAAPLMLYFFFWRDIDE